MWQLSFCSNRFKISVNFLKTVKLLIAKSHICLGSFFVHMMMQLPNLQRWILFFVFYICNNSHFLKFFTFSPTVVFSPYHRRNFWFWTIYFLLVQKSIVNEKSIVYETTYKSLSTNLSRKVLSESCLEVLSVKFDFKFLSFCTFQAFFWYQNL